MQLSKLVTNAPKRLSSLVHLHLHSCLLVPSTTPSIARCEIRHHEDSRCESARSYDLRQEYSSIQGMIAFSFFVTKCFCEVREEIFTRYDLAVVSLVWKQKIVRGAGSLGRVSANLTKATLDQNLNQPLEKAAPFSLVFLEETHLKISLNGNHE